MSFFKIQYRVVRHKGAFWPQYKWIAIFPWCRFERSDVEKTCYKDLDFNFNRETGDGYNCEKLTLTTQREADMFLRRHHRYNHPKIMDHDLCEDDGACDFCKQRFDCIFSSSQISLIKKNKK